ncbi:MAG: substrate-binding domain-containing protein [Desulfonatronovibrio sp.]
MDRGIVYKKFFFIIALAVVFAVLVSIFFLLSKKRTMGPQVLEKAAEFYDSSHLEPIRMKGPHNEPPATLADLKSLAADLDLKALGKKNPRIAVCMQDLDPENDWSQLQVRGIANTLELFGFEISILTNGEFDNHKQLADYRNILILQPDILITIPLDKHLMAPVLQEIADSGTAIIFMDSTAQAMAPGKDYATLVMADSYSNAWVGIEILAQRLNGNGKLALMHWQNNMFTTDQRSIAARAASAEHSGLEVAAELYFSSIADVEPMTEDLLDEHPDLDGLWVVWDTPALEAVEVIRRRGAGTLVTTVDLGQEAAHMIGANDILIGTGAQHPYHQGVAEGLAAVLIAGGIAPPPFVLVPGEKVTSETLEVAWRNIFQKELQLSSTSGDGFEHGSFSE